MSRRRAAAYWSTPAGGHKRTSPADGFGGRRYKPPTWIAVDVTPYGVEHTVTTWISIAAFGQAGEALARPAKGDRIGIMGRREQARRLARAAG